MSANLPREEVNRRKILKAARQLFIESAGVEGINMHQVAKTAGVGQASLYRRYQALGDVCVDVVLEECQPLFEEIQTYLNQSKEISPLDRLNQVIKKVIDFLRAKLPWLCAVSRASSGYRPLQSPLYQWMRTTYKSLLKEAAEQGEIVNVDVSYTVESLIATLHNIDIHINQGFSTEQILLGIHRVFIEGLKSVHENTKT